MIRGIHHPAISTVNLERSLRFYRDILGFEVVLTFDWGPGNEIINKIVDLPDSRARGVVLNAGNAFLELFEYSSPVPSRSKSVRRVCDHGYTHICLDVLDTDSEYERLKAAGMTFHCRPQFEGEVRTIYGRDPDGNVIEMQEIKDTAPHYLRTAPSAL